MIAGGFRQIEGVVQRGASVYTMTLRDLRTHGQTSAESVPEGLGQTNRGGAGQWLPAAAGSIVRLTVDRLLPGEDPYAISERAATCPLAYRYLDHLVSKVLTQPQGCAMLFPFLRGEAMRGLFQYCNELLDLAEGLRAHIEKTGDVLYESLVPLATRKILSQLHPHFLAVFLHNPSLPIELIRETGSPMTSGQLAQAGSDAQCERELKRFWSMRCAIGHMSSVNFYETNLTSNIAFFDPPGRTKLDDLRVLLCSNPTRDLFYSSQEASKIADFFAPAASPPAGDAPVAHSEKRSIEAVRDFIWW